MLSAKFSHMLCLPGRWSGIGNMGSANIPTKGVLKDLFAASYLSPSAS